MRLSLWGLGILLLFSSSLRAENASLVNVFPAGRASGFLPLAVVYPGFSTAILQNPAALPSGAKATALHLAGTTTLSTPDSPELFASLAHSNKKLAIEMIYAGYLMPGFNSHGAAAGFGYSMDTFSVGLTARDSSISSGIEPSIDIGLLLGGNSELTLGAVFYSLNGTSQLAVGAGTRGGKKYTIEANVLLPPFNNIGSGYLFSVNAQLFASALGFNFGASYYTSTSTFYHTLGLGFWIMDNVHMIVQFSSYNLYTVALTFTF